MAGGRVGLVIERELRVRLRSRVFLISTLVLLVGALCAVIIPQVVGDDGPGHAEIAVSGGPRGLPPALVVAGEARGLRVTVTPRSEAAARAAVAAGEDDVAVIDRGAGAPARVLVEHDLSDGLRAVLTQGLSAARVGSALTGAGLPPAAVARLTAAPALEVVPTSGTAGPSSGDVGIGVLVAVVLYVALLAAGTLVATGVAEEKTSRVSEVLLATLRPSQLLLGKIAGIGIVSIVQLAIAALPALVAAGLVGAVELPDATAATVAWGLAWFVAGYALYATAYGALGALVGRQQEVGQVTAPLMVLLLAGYLASATVAASHPGGGAARLLSLIPPFSPMVMPVRIAAGTVGTPEILLALALTLVLAALVLRLGAAVYRGGIVVTGARIGLRAALAGRARS